VLLAMVDMQALVQGKRLTVEHFLDEVVRHNAEGCNYQLAGDIEMNPVPGYRHASWSTGYGDFVFVPDLSTLRRIPWHDGTALVMCDLAWEDGTPVANAAQQVIERADWVTTRAGGDGAVREAIEHLLGPSGKWADVVKRYAQE